MGVVGEGRGNSMIGESKGLDVPSPDKYVERDVIDLKVEFGKFQEKINNIEKKYVYQRNARKEQAGISKVVSSDTDSSIRCGIGRTSNFMVKIAY